MGDVSVILLAGGKGTRMQMSIPKQFLQLGKKLVACHSLEVFLSFPQVKEVVVVCDPLFRSFFSSYPVKFALPGNRRQDSVYQGLKEISPETKWVCIHDAARPFISTTMLQRLFQEGKAVGAATVGMPLKWTVKQIQENGLVDKTLDRERIWEIQTPQFLAKEVLEEGFEVAFKRNLTVTDDVSLAELLSHPVKLVEGAYTNIKITTPDDLHFAKKLLTVV